MKMNLKQNLNLKQKMNQSRRKRRRLFHQAWRHPMQQQQHQVPRELNPMTTLFGPENKKLHPKTHIRMKNLKNRDKAVINAKVADQGEDLEIRGIEADVKRWILKHKNLKKLALNQKTLMLLLMIY